MEEWHNDRGFYFGDLLFKQEEKSSAWKKVEKIMAVDIFLIRWGAGIQGLSIVSHVVIL